MARTRRFLDLHLPQLDAVLEVTDARGPRSCRWHGLPALLQGKPRILILNKADLADPAVTTAWRQRSAEIDGVPAVALTAVSGGDEARSQARELLDVIRSVAPRRASHRSIKIAAVGVPNVGKSSVLNLIGGRHKAPTGAKPGLTRGQQWMVVAGGIWLLDLPGVLPPAPRDAQELAVLALLGTLPAGAFSDSEAALFLLGRLAAEYNPDQIASMLRLAQDGPGAAGAVAPLERLTAWALRRGALGTGGVPDLERAAAMLVAEFRRGGLGKISLERPPGPVIV